MSEEETGLLDDAIRLVLAHTPPSAGGNPRADPPSR